MTLLIRANLSNWFFRNSLFYLILSRKKTISAWHKLLEGKTFNLNEWSCQKSNQMKTEGFSWMFGAAKASVSAASNAVAWGTSILALNRPRAGNNEPNSGFQRLRCVWGRRNKMAEINGSFKLQARCFGFLRSGGRWPCFDEVLFFLLALLHLVSLSRRWNVWYEGKPFFILVTSHIFDPLRAFCYFPFFFFYSWSLTVLLSPPFPVPLVFLPLLSSHTEWGMYFPKEYGTVWVGSLSLPYMPVQLCLALLFPKIQ